MFSTVFLRLVVSFSLFLVLGSSYVAVRTVTPTRYPSRLPRSGGSTLALRVRAGFRRRGTRSFHYLIGAFVFWATVAADDRGAPLANPSPTWFFTGFF